MSVELSIDEPIRRRRWEHSGLTVLVQAPAIKTTLIESFPTVGDRARY